jgi:hypothetical protein
MSQLPPQSPLASRSDNTGKSHRRQYQVHLNRCPAGPAQRCQVNFLSISLKSEKASGFFFQAITGLIKYSRQTMGPKDAHKNPIRFAHPKQRIRNS